MKLIAFITFMLGVAMLVIFFICEGVRQEKTRTNSSKDTKLDNQKETNELSAPFPKTCSIHDFFREEDTLSREDDSEANTDPARNPYTGYVADKFLINRRQNAIYERLEYLLSGDYRISPKIRVTDIIRPEKRIIETDPERATVLSGNLNNARFDFVITTLDTGKISGIVMTEKTLNSLPSGPFIAELLSRLNIPLFRYADSSYISNDQLSNLLYEKFEGNLNYSKSSGVSVSD